MALGESLFWASIFLEDIYFSGVKFWSFFFVLGGLNEILLIESLFRGALSSSSFLHFERESAYSATSSRLLVFFGCISRV